MPHTAEVDFEGSIANALGVLYERKARGTTLIRVLEDYRRFKAMNRTSHRTWGSLSPEASAVPKQELEQLYLRRAAVDQVIRSIEAYSGAQNSAHTHR